ncbi:MAG: porin [Gammaproteobacteria bacterium]|nr:porin [Gammaproteobacteria bacterium]
MKYDYIRNSLSTRLITAAISSVLIVPGAAQAFEAKLSGQVSRMVVLPDDAVGDEIQHQDIGWSGSRFRFTGSEEADNGLTWGFRFEIQARNNNAGTDGGQLSNNGDNQDNRYQDLYLSGDFGKISFGKGDGASNGSTEVDLSGTALASAAPLQDNWGGYAILPDGTKWNTVFTMFDGLSRQNRVRYDTPSFNGFSVAGSINQGNATELALRYNGDLGGHKFGAAVFVDQAPDVSSSVDGADVTGGSASLLLNSGLNFTVAFSESDPDSGDASDSTFFKVGYKTGMHAFSVDLANGENGAGDEGDSTGFTYAFFPHKGVEIFAMIRELDSSGVAGAESIDLTAIGSRIKF